MISELFQEHPQWGRADDERWKSWTGNLWVGTEGVLLANVASRFPGQALLFDPVTCRIVNHAEADAELRPHYREGWTL